MLPKNQSLQEFLDEKASFYNCKDFIPSDPISIPHLFNKKEDIEIAGFLAAALAWGQRVTIINKSIELMNRMGNSPHEFVVNATDDNMVKLSGFVHRTFQEDDCMYFIHTLQQMYRNEGGLEAVFTHGFKVKGSVKDAIVHFRNEFFKYGHLQRTRKHVSNPDEGSAAKRLNMFLRWMVRDDGNGVDFGLWKTISVSDLMCPLDVHSGNIARRLGLLERKQNDWTAVEELTANLKEFDANDPVKYDFALFGIGVNE